jgi:hypothetical protein
VGTVLGIPSWFFLFLLVGIHQLTTNINASEQSDKERLLAPTPLAFTNEEEQELKYQDIKEKAHYAALKLYQNLERCKGSGGRAELLAFYALLPTSLQGLIDEYCNFVHPSSFNYDNIAWHRWVYKRFSSTIARPPRGYKYSLYQQLFLVALFNEYNRGECDLPKKSIAADKDVYEIYTSFHERDRQLMQFIKLSLPAVHACKAAKEFCTLRVEPIMKRTPSSEGMYYFSYPRVMHINDDGALLLLIPGNLYRYCLLVRTMEGRQYHLDYINTHEESYGALWSNNGQRIISVKKVSIKKEDSLAKSEEEKEAKKNIPHNLDMPTKNMPTKKGMRSSKKRVQRKRGSVNSSEYSSSNSSNSSDDYLPDCKIQCTVWSWPDLARLEDACIVDNFNMAYYDEAIREQDHKLHNYMYAKYHDLTREIVFIVPPYKHRWRYSFKTKKIIDYHMSNLCDGVVLSNGLTYGICPKGSVIKYGATNDSFSFSWWQNFKWKGYHSSSKLRAYNIADNGSMIGISMDGDLLELPSGRFLGYKTSEVGTMRDDWPIIISPGNRCAMIPVWYAPKKASTGWYEGIEAAVSWVFWKFALPRKPLMSPLHHHEISTRSTSDSAMSSSSNGSLLVGSTLFASVKGPEECCISM